MRVSPSSMMIRTLCYSTVVAIVAGASLDGKNIFKKVSNKYPVNDLALCLLGELNIGNIQRPKVPCLTACAANPGCYLACFDGSLCYLYKAIVSIYYTADNAQYQPTTELQNTECYSSYVHDNDITPQIVGTSVSSTYPSSGLVKSLAFDGYYCPAEVYAWVSYYHNNELYGSGWLIADLGKPYKITKLIAQTRTVWQNFFRGIEVRIGNQNSTGNALWVSYLGPAVDGSIVTLEGVSPARGRYVSIISLNYYLVLAELKIIGEVV